MREIFSTTFVLCSTILCGLKFVTPTGSLFYMRYIIKQCLICEIPIQIRILYFYPIIMNNFNLKMSNSSDPKYMQK